MADKKFTKALAPISAEYEEEDGQDPIGRPRENGLSAGNDEGGAGESVDEITPLDEGGSRLMTQQENRIQTALKGFFEIGDALEIIRSNKLYRGTHRTWESYTIDRWGLDRKRAYQLINSSKVVADIAAWKPMVVLNTSGASPATSDGTAIQPTILNKKRPVKLDRSGQPEDVEFTEADQPGGLLEEGDRESTPAERSPLTTVTDEPAEAGGDWLVATAQSPPDNTSMPLPQVESHAAALVGVDPAERGEIWEGVLKQSQETGQAITANMVKEKVSEKAGEPAVPRNKKAPKDPKPRKKKGEDEGSDLDGSTLDINAFTRPSGGSTVTPYAWDDAEDGEGPIAFEEQQSFEPGSREAHIVEMGKGMRKAVPAFGEVMISVSGSWLLRAGVAEQWQTLRGDDRPIDENYKETLTLQEANELKLLGILARL
jgi:hypothetical protein